MEFERREEASFSLSFDQDTGGGGQRMLDKEGGEERKEEQMKNIRRKALSHRHQLPAFTSSFPFSYSLSLHKFLPTREQKMKTGALVPS